MTSAGVGSVAQPGRKWVGRSAIALLSKPVVYGPILPTITFLNALVGMLLPMLMTPRVFGEYALVVTLFQYGLIFDCGAGQLADRWIPAAFARGRTEEVDRLSQRLLWVRLYIGTVLLVVAIIALTLLKAFDQLPFGFWAGVLSASAGISYMVAMGPAFIYRTLSERRNYAFAIGVLSFGLVVARPLGLFAGGLIGCFFGLVLWYLAFGFLLHWQMPPRLTTRPTPVQAASSVIQGLPFFATSFVWAFYLTANRWFASHLMNSGTFGHFAFSANIYTLLIGAIGSLSAFYYPRIVGRIAQEGCFALSKTILVDFSKLILLSGGIVAVGIFLTAPLLAFIYPQYYQSAATARTLLAAVPATGLVSWLLPISLSSGRRPWIDGLLVYPAATAILYCAMRILFQRFGDIGSAAASTVSALPLLGMLLVQLRHAHVFRTSAALTLMGLATIVTTALCALAWAMK
ncbi:MAG: rane protein [Rhodospirillales bacterium]|nr:rane protein [Rhodospirillales bacterium]